MELQISDKNIAEQNKKICKNCGGFNGCACYRRPSIILYLFGQKFVRFDDNCWKFKLNKLQNQKTR